MPRDDAGERGDVVELHDEVEVIVLGTRSARVSPSPTEANGERCRGPSTHASGPKPRSHFGS